MIGVAAHIYGAASGRGSRRYLASMTPEQRSDITNAIWHIIPPPLTQGAEWSEGLGEAPRHQHGQGADLWRSPHRAEAGRQVP
jgi:hypothetical protein